LSGITLALALIPEAIAFSFVAKVDPMVGLWAAFIMGLMTAIFGGRPGMIS
jgi:SulP family sulfate permease